MTKYPDEIYLQKEESEEVTWCEDKINDDDVKYIKAEKVREAIEKWYIIFKNSRKFDWSESLLKELGVDEE